MDRYVAIEPQDLVLFKDCYVANYCSNIEYCSLCIQYDIKWQELASQQSEKIYVCPNESLLSKNWKRKQLSAKLSRSLEFHSPKCRAFGRQSKSFYPHIKAT